MMAPRVLLLLYLRNLRQVPRIPTVLVFGIAMPLIQLLLFGSVFGATTSIPGHPYPDVPYTSFIAPAIVLLAAFVGMANASAALLVDLRTGYFDKLRTTPASAPLAILARLLAEMTRVTGQALIVLAVALLLGARVGTGVLGAVLMVLCAVVFSACTTGLASTALALKTRSDQATQSALPLFFILLFLSTAYMPRSILPDWLASTVVYNPIDHLIRGLRALMLESWGEAWAGLGVGMAFALGCAMLLGAVNARIHRRMTQ